MRWLVVPVLLATLAGCSVPRDPEGTLTRVQQGVLRAGFTEAEPFAAGTAEDPSGVEVDLVEQFAQELGATVEWTVGSEAELLKAVEVRALDIVVGGLDAANPAAAAAGMSRPYATTHLTVGIPLDDPVPQEIAGMRIAAEAGTEAIGLLQAADAEPVVVADIAEADGPAATEDWMLDDLGLVDSRHYLAESKHVMVVPPGENAFLVELERFLHRNRAAISDAIVEASTA